MSLLTALNTGATGMEANSLDLDVIGDNISNANTIGFKAGRAAFRDALYQELIGAPGGGQMGLGVQLNAVQRIISQGALTNTGVATDLALEGSGYFVVKGNHDGINGQFYTRAGQFSVDKNGYLSNLEGLRVQGYTANTAGVLGAQLGDLNVGAVTAQPTATKNITIRANLAANATVPAAAWDPANPDTTSNFHSTVNIYDSLGVQHDVTMYYVKTASGAWDFHAMTDGGGLTGGTAGTPTEIATGSVTFDSSGHLATVTQSSNFNPLGATQPQPLTFNLGTSTAAGGAGNDGLTQYQDQAGYGGTSSPANDLYIAQDGNSYGTLSSVSINNQGQIIGSFTNGGTQTLGEVAVAGFQANDQVRRIGGNLVIESAASGQPTIGAPGSGGRASVVSGALEQSNVDIANEFVRMIAAQRGFQANSKTITTADALLQELMNLKR
jgi:flagellar hook protein FlgE